MFNNIDWILLGREDHSFFTVGRSIYHLKVGRATGLRKIKDTLETVTSAGQRAKRNVIDLYNLGPGVVNSASTRRSWKDGDTRTAGKIPRECPHRQIKQTQVEWLSASRSKILQRCRSAVEQPLGLVLA